MGWVNAYLSWFTDMTVKLRIQIRFILKCFIWKSRRRISQLLLDGSDKYLRENLTVKHRKILPRFIYNLSGIRSFRASDKCAGVCDHTLFHKPVYHIPYRMILSKIRFLGALINGPGCVLSPWRRFVLGCGSKCEWIWPVLHWRWVWLYAIHYSFFWLIRLCVARQSDRG